MNTYDSYAAAKIAMPESTIYEYEGNFSLFKGLGSTECNPADHCSTLAEFLEAGYKLVDGDVVWHDGVKCLFKMSRHDDYNSPMGCDHKISILSAAAIGGGSKIPAQQKRTKESTAIETLEKMGFEWKGGELWKPPVGSAPEYIKPKRTNVEYVKVIESIFDLKGEFERGDLYVFNGGNYTECKYDGDVATGFVHAKLFRRIETEISARDLIENEIKTLGDKYKEENGYSDEEVDEKFYTFLANSGRFKLA
ncbi:hypothetical protein NVP1084O_134 [Vibrio phage 1.084.O._10N.261.49.F5]|nr:hypothetical protein NVP1084O_134 [Vibrio phage 1.084.O._10N.261.49.F5]